MAVRRNARTLLALLASVTIGLGVAACGDSGPDRPEQDANAPLDIWIRKPPGSPTEQTAKTMAAEFTKKTGIETKMTSIFEDFETKLAQAAAGKNLPDIVINDTAQLGTLVEQGVVRPVDRDAIAGGESVTDLAWQATKSVDGNHYAVPFSAQAFALFIRKDWREALGLPVPTSLADLDAMARAFTTQDPDADGQQNTYGYVVPGTTKRGYLAWYFTTFLWSSGGDFLTERDGKFTPAIAEPKSVAAVAWFKNQFCTDNTVAPGAVTMEAIQAHPVFETGKAGIYLTGPYNMARFDKSLGTDKFEIVPAPAGQGGTPTALAEGENVYLMAGSSNETGQQKFAEFAISEQGQTIGMAGDTDGNIVRLPVNSDITLAEIRDDTRWQVFDKIYADAARYTPRVPDWTPFLQASAETLNAVVADCDSDVKSSLDELAEKFGGELDRQGVAG